jgi:hypothetical protein
MKLNSSRTFSVPTAIRNPASSSITLLNRAPASAVGRCFAGMILVFALAQGLSAVPMVYTGLVVTDVRVGTNLMHNASLKITFVGDTDNLLQVPVPSQECGGIGYFLYLTQGVARMEIGFRGRTQTARLQDGQIFVAIDECNGGIGFGSFIGPNGLEPAYPLAFTMGTSEYTAITGGSPLTYPLSVTGAAWSCIGYPPGGASALPATASGNCIPPDSYPLASDIGDIFIYQPYFEYVAPANTAIASNHSGSTNRGVFLVRPQTSGKLAVYGDGDAPDRTTGSRLVYTLQTVADGSIGGHVFYQALVTFQMVSNTESVTWQPSLVDPTRPIFVNRAGHTTVTIDDNGSITTAEFAPQEVYVRYDTGAGVAGFGSRISPTYPVALNCANTAYPSDAAYTVDCLQGDTWDYLNINDSSRIFHGGTLAQLNYPVLPSAGVTSLPQSLSQSTLLTGSTHTCAGVYTIGPTPSLPYYFPGDLLVCAGPAPRGLHTSRGDFFLQDLVGGSLDLGNSVIVGNEAASDPGWDLANSGFLHVQVYRGDD